MHEVAERAAGLGTAPGRGAAAAGRARPRRSAGIPARLARRRACPSGRPGPEHRRATARRAQVVTAGPEPAHRVETH